MVGSGPNAAFEGFHRAQLPAVLADGPAPADQRQDEPQGT
jgi:predicted HAD superfamily Cof-like phosphohydrolase